MRKLPWPEITIVVLVLAAGLGVFLYAHRDQDDLEGTKDRGEQIVTALEAYRSAEGEYPDSLPQLAPRFVPQVEPPLWGMQQWRYRLVSAEIFQLSVPKNETGYPALNYDVYLGRFVLNN